MFVLFSFIAYNLAQALFSGTAPLIQTSLVLFRPVEQSSDSGQVAFDLFHDNRLRPAYYIMSVAFISFIAILVGVPYVQECRRREDAKTQRGCLCSEEYSRQQLHSGLYLSDSSLESYPFPSAPCEYVDNPLAAYVCDAQIARKI